MRVPERLSSAIVFAVLAAYGIWAFIVPWFGSVPSAPAGGDYLNHGTLALPFYVHKLGAPYANVLAHPEPSAARAAYRKLSDVRWSPRPRAASPCEASPIPQPSIGQIGQK